MKSEPEDRDLDLWDDQEELAGGVMHLERSLDSDCTAVDRAASDALARIVLAGFEERLPNFYIVGPKAVVMTRKPRSKRSMPVQAIRPIFLFDINWADSAPGFSWPEGYHLGWLPGFDGWIVTASRDTWEVEGYCDRVVDHFVTCDDLVAEASSRIVKYWRDLHQNCEQERWAYLFDSGRISDAEAEDMADTVWKLERKEDEDDLAAGVHA